MSGVRALAAATVLPLLLGLLAGCGARSGEAGQPVPAVTMDSSQQGVVAQGDPEGFAAEPPTEIMGAALDAVDRLVSVRVRGSVGTGRDAAVYDLEITPRGACMGFVRLGGQRMEIRRTTVDTWVRYSQGFWRKHFGARGLSIWRVVGDRWLVVPEDEDRFSTMCELDVVLGGIQGLRDQDVSATTKDARVIGVETVNDREAVKLVAFDPDGGTAALWVALDDPHHLVRMRATRDGTASEMELSEQDKGVLVEAPDPDDVATPKELRREPGNWFRV